MAKKFGELVELNEIIFKGYMKKAPPQKSKVFFNFISKFSCTNNGSSVLRKRWTKRYFVLYKTSRPSQVYLIYFKVEPTPECKSTGNINLVKLTNLSVDVGSTFNRSNVFSIQTSDDKGENRVYFLCTQTSDLMNKWVDKIVTSLNLNNHNSRFNSVSTLSSPTSHISTRGIPRGSQNYSSTSRLDSSVLSSHTLPETHRFSFSNMNGGSTDNATSSYYNLSPSKGSFFQENLQDPISNEDEEEMYKVPCENPNSHLYANLGEDEATPIATIPKVSGDLFFGNDDNVFNSIPDAKTVNISTFQECKIPVEDKVFEDKNSTSYRRENHFQKESPENNQVDGYTCDFDFLLPTRMRTTSTSSSSSSSSSSSNDNAANNFIRSQKEVEIKPLPSCDLSPPRVPRRLNLPEINKNNVTSETVLPLKTPKPFLPKNGSKDFESSLADELFSSLNYMDSTNLLLGNNNHHPKLELLRDSTYSGLSATSNNYTNSPLALTSSELKWTDLSIDRCDSPCHVNVEDSLSPSVSTQVSNVKDIVPLVEYREISEARTEALLKLNDRIVNN